MHRFRAFFLVALLAPAAHADRIADEASHQDALLRRYSTSEAESRLDAERRNPDAATQALGAGMSNLMNRMYRRCASRPTTGKDWNGYCAIAPARPLPPTGWRSSTPND